MHSSSFLSISFCTFGHTCRLRGETALYVCLHVSPSKGHGASNRRASTDNSHSNTHTDTHTRAQPQEWLPPSLMCIVTTVCPHCQGRTPIWPQSSQHSATHLDSRNKPAEHSCLSPSVSERSLFGSHHTKRWETVTGARQTKDQHQLKTETSGAGCQINYTEDLYKPSRQMASKEGSTFQSKLYINGQKSRDVNDKLNDLLFLYLYNSTIGSKVSRECPQSPCLCKNELGKRDWKWSATKQRTFSYCWEFLCKRIIWTLY